uniref:Uncharacterized protein n=1 Tax=Anopheles maculatus TaxID=74869 RepID=A0A182T440_9DIPT
MKDVPVSGISFQEIFKPDHEGPPTTQVIIYKPKSGKGQPTAKVIVTKVCRCRQRLFACLSLVSMECFLVLSLYSCLFYCPLHIKNDMVLAPRVSFSVPISVVFPRL